jgi:hypothetical protein
MSHVAMLSAAAEARLAANTICCGLVSPKRRERWTSTADGQPKSAIVTKMKKTAMIMKVTPP